MKSVVENCSAVHVCPGVRLTGERTKRSIYRNYFVHDIIVWGLKNSFAYFGQEFFALTDERTSLFGCASF